MPLDLAIDGTDEIDAQLRLIKGRGGALLREKIVEQQALRFIVIADESKIVDRLGVGVLPVEVTPFARDVLHRALQEMGLEPVQRMRDGSRASRTKVISSSTCSFRRTRTSRTSSRAFAIMRAWSRQGSFRAKRPRRSSRARRAAPHETKVS